MGGPVVNRVGQRFGRLVVSNRAPNNGRHVMWHCACECGGECGVHGSSLHGGLTRSCGCFQSESRKTAKVKDEAGNRYGRLVVIRRSEDDDKPGARWACRCDCGKETFARGANLRRGSKLSCGCLSADTARTRMSLPRGEAMIRNTLRFMKRNASKRGYSWEITDEQALDYMSEECFYCGAPPSNVSRTQWCNGEFTYSGLDRVDNTKGYMAGNVVPCCRHCNIAKGERSVDEFETWAARIVQKRNC